MRKFLLFYAFFLVFAFVAFSFIDSTNKSALLSRALVVKFINHIENEEYDRAVGFMAYEDEGHLIKLSEADQDMTGDLHAVLREMTDLLHNHDLEMGTVRQDAESQSMEVPVHLKQDGQVVRKYSFHLVDHDGELLVTQIE